jgi:hypothetical protein
MDGVQPSAARTIGNNQPTRQAGSEIRRPTNPAAANGRSPSSRLQSKSGKSNGSNKRKPQRIGIVSIIFLIITAIIFDLISLIPFVNIVSGLIAYAVFGIWFYILGVGFMNPKRFATAAVSAVIGFIPFLSMLPELTIAVIVVILMVKSEDTLGIKLPGVGAKPK